MPVAIAGSRGNPFLSHGFLKALEDSKCLGRGTGWMPQHLVAEDDAGAVLGIVPMFLKSHSQGEYVFDHGWRRPSARRRPLLSQAAGLRAVHAGARPAHPAAARTLARTSSTPWSRRW